MKEKRELRVRPWTYEPEKPDQIADKQREMMTPKGKPDMSGVFRR